MWQEFGLTNSFTLEASMFGPVIEAPPPLPSAASNAAPLDPHFDTTHLWGRALVSVALRSQR